MLVEEDGVGLGGVQDRLLPVGVDGDSTAATMTVPRCTPSAPRASAAAMVFPSKKPPAAMTGTSKAVVTDGSRTIVETGRGLLNPPPSPPSTINPSTPASTGLTAARRVGTTWKTVSPASSGQPGAPEI